MTLHSIGPKQKIGFACSGGGTKAGAFHLGVALALQEKGFEFGGGLAPSLGEVPKPGPNTISTYVGSSAGSILCTYLAAGYTLDQIIDSFLGRKPSKTAWLNTPQKPLPQLTYKKMFKLQGPDLLKKLGGAWNVSQTLTQVLAGDWRALLKLEWPRINGLFSTHGIESYIREEVLPSNRFQDYLADLFIVATQLNHSRKVVFGKHHFEPPPEDLTCQYSNEVGISDACAASAALPVIFAPHLIKAPHQKSAYYIDGEIRDTLSSHVAADNGADLVFASYTHQPFHSTPEVTSLTQAGIPSIIVQSIYLVIEQKINNYIFNKRSARAAIHSVSKYCKESGISEEHRKTICKILEKELALRPSVDIIYIHPKASDSKFFFSDHFSLSAKKLHEIVKSGFRAAIETLDKYEFSTQNKNPTVLIKTKRTT